MANIQDFIIHDKPKELIGAAESLGEKLKNQGLTTSQIRNLFGMVRQIKMNWSIDPTGSYRQAVLLKPKIWYQIKRLEKIKRLRDLPNLFEKEFIPALDAVIDASDEDKKVRFERFTDYFEAVVAYHKRFGGEE